MIVELHRLTGYWLSGPDDAARTGDATGEHARVCFERMRAAIAHLTDEPGHIASGYDPATLPDKPGYAWLRARLADVQAREPAFDDVPEPPSKGDKPVFEHWDSFPAFFWRATEPGGTRGLLEVLVGRDTLVLHQSAARLSAGSGLEDMRRELRASPWLGAGDTAVGAPLFTADILQVSPTPDASSSDDGWAEACLDPFGRNVGSVVFSPDDATYEIRLGLQPLDPGGHLEAALRLLRTLRGRRDDPWEVHTDAGRLIVRLCTALINARKVAYEHEQARRMFDAIEAGQQEARQRLDALRREHRHVLAPPLSYAEVEELRGMHRRARSAFEQADRLVNTCRWNVNQFQDVCAEFLSGGHAWAQTTLISLRRLSDQMDALYQSARRGVEALTSDVELEITTGARAVTATHARELIRFRDTRTQRPEGFVRLLVSGDEAQVPGVPTHWHTPRGRPCEVLRPADLGPEQLDELKLLYRGILHESSVSQLDDLVSALCDRSGRLYLLPATDGAAPVELPVGQVIGGDPEAGAALLARLPWETSGRFLHCSTAYSCQSPDDPAVVAARAQEHWEAFACLLTLLEAVTDFLAHPAEHLTGAVERHAAQRIRLLSMAGLLRLVAGDAERGWHCLHRAAQAALARQDFKWAYFVAQMLSEAERRGVQHTPPADEAGAEAPREPTPSGGAGALRAPVDADWRVRLGREFLRVFDLESATRIAGSRRGDTLGQPRYRARRALLWGLALAVGGTLLGADWTLSHRLVADPWRPDILHGSALLALLGAPLAFAVAGLRATPRLFPDILYPRIFGAITIAVLTFGTTDQTATILALSGLSISLPLALIAIAGGFTYLYHEIRPRVVGRGARWRRCADVFALVFLEAVCVTTIVLLAYQRLFQKIYEAAEISRVAAFTYGELFFRPGSVFLIAVVSMFAGIVLQLMFEFGGQAAREEPRSGSIQGGMERERE